MKKIGAVFTIIMIALVALPMGASAIDEVGKMERVIVFFKDMKSMKTTILPSSAGDVQKRFVNLPVIVMDVPMDRIDDLERVSTVRKVEINKEIKISNQDVELKNLDSKVSYVDWGIEHVKAKNAWDAGYKGTGIKVAIADTGIDMLHPDLAFAGGTSFVEDYDESGALDNSVQDYHGHGTHVAGIIAAKDNGIGVTGVAPHVELFVLKIFNNSGVGTTYSLLSAVDWAITNEIDILNLSLGSQNDFESYRLMFDKAYDSNMLVLAAAGNDNLKNVDNGVDYPALYSTTIAVGAIDSNNKIADFSSRGPAVEVVAPGVGITSTYLNGKYASMSGTSMATPYATGVMALYKEANKNLTNDELRNTMTSDVVDLGVSGRDNDFGFGYIQAPSAAVAPITVFNDYISFFEPSKLYNAPYLSGSVASNISPQTLYAFRKKGQWYEVKTWLGSKWIKPKLLVEGKPTEVTKRIKLTARTFLHDAPNIDTIRSESVSPQYLYSIRDWNGWYLVQTWVGLKWIKPQNAEIEPYIERLDLTNRTILHTYDDEYYKTSNSLNPQSVYAYEKHGEWYKIKTWLGYQWIKPTQSSIEKPTVQNKYMEITEKLSLYELPHGDKSGGANVSPQTVYVYEKIGNWYLIRTWLGKKWIQN